MLVVTFGFAVVVGVIAVVMVAILKVVFLNDANGCTYCGTNRCSFGGIATGGFGNNGSGNGAANCFFCDIVGVSGERQAQAQGGGEGGDYGVFQCILHGFDLSGFDVFVRGSSLSVTLISPFSSLTAFSGGTQMCEFGTAGTNYRRRLKSHSNRKKMSRNQD